MKIEGHGPNQLGSTHEAQSAQANERVQGRRTDLETREAEARGDRVEVSGDARLISTALRAVERAPEVRQDVVERARQKLAAGEIGHDPVKLADRMIDSLLGR
jgi:flagellar biosynthesis anti-sigma factor FlgM